MSWDVFISKEEVKNLEDGNLAPISEKEEFIKNLASIIPNINYSDEQWGVFKDANCSIEFDIGDEDIVTHIMLYIRGRGEYPLAMIKSICDNFECYAMDCSTGDQMNFETLDSDSFIAWQNYRDKIIGKN